AELLGEDSSGPVLMTRADADQVAAASARNPGAAIHGSIVVWRPALERPGRVLVITAGTPELPAAEECRVTLTAFGFRPQTLTDVGVAGVHRLAVSVDEL